MTEAQDHTSPLALARLLSGKATEAERGALQAHAAACLRCRAALDEAREAERHFAEVVYPRTLPALQARRAPPPRRWTLLPVGLGTALAAAAALFLVVRSGPGPELQAKGAASLAVFARRGERVFPVKDGASLRAGDRIRFGVAPGPARFVLVASIDGRGHVSVYQESTPVGAQAGPLALLPDSIVLDDAPGPERIFAVFSERRLPAQEVTGALATLGAAGAEGIRRTRRLPLPFEQASILVEKDPAGPAPR
jgi:hypothetical protein